MIETRRARILIVFIVFLIVGIFASVSHICKLVVVGQIYQVKPPTNRENLVLLQLLVIMKVDYDDRERSCDVVSMCKTSAEMLLYVAMILKDTAAQDLAGPDTDKRPHTMQADREVTTNMDLLHPGVIPRLKSFISYWIPGSIIPI